MDFSRSRASYLASTWAIEALARSSQVDVSVLLELLERTPQITGDFGRNARESACLRILESILAKAPNVNSLPRNKNRKISLDPSELCEDVLRRILTEARGSSINRSEILKWDVGPFIEHKRSRLAKNALQQLKHAIRSGKHSSLASLREQSGLSVEKQLEHGAPINDGKHSNVTGRPVESARSGSKVSGMEHPDESFIPVSRKRSAAEAIDSEKSCRDQISSRNVEKPNVGSVKKQKHNVHERKNEILVQNNRRLNRSLEKSHDLGPKAPSVPDNEHTSSRAAVGVDELLPRANRVHRVDGELNRKCAREHQRHDVEKAKDGRGAFSRLNITNKGPCISETDVGKNAENVVDGENVGAIGDSYWKTNGKTNIPSEIRTTDEGSSRRGSSGRGHASTETQNLHRGSDTANDYSHVEPGKDDHAADARGKMKVVHEFGAAKEVDEAHVSSDRPVDGATDVLGKKKRFLSSQCTYSQEPLIASDSRDLNLCLKCNKGGKVLICSSDTCSLMIHDSCLGLDKRFDLGEKFYCPFCVYSRTITKFMEIKKKAFSARKYLADFVSDGLGQKSNKHRRPCSANYSTLEKNGNGLPKCDDPNVTNDVGKATCSRSKKDPQFEQRESSFPRSEKAIGGPKQEKQHTYPLPPKPKRQLMPWTTEEENLLMEQVKRFSAPGTTIPWTKILELGANVFQGRRPIDLKNKWRSTVRKAASK